jgi:WhiB family redox-sensing transcriptional regulator
MSGRPIPECGTRSAYQRHKRLGEPVDDACRAANTAADRRLRETGTTKKKPTEPVERPPAAKAPAASLRAHAWQEFAACRTVDPELFHPDSGRHDMAARAKQVCKRCPVLDACHAHALGDDGCRPERYGVWGGMTEDQRATVFRRRARARTKAVA